MRELRDNVRIFKFPNSFHLGSTETILCIVIHRSPWVHMSFCWTLKHLSWGQRDNSKDWSSCFVCKRQRGLFLEQLLNIKTEDSTSSSTNWDSQYETKKHKLSFLGKFSLPELLHFFRGISLNLVLLLSLIPFLWALTVFAYAY